MFDTPKRPAPPPIRNTGLGQPIVEDVEASLKAYGGSRFDMIITASKRVRELNKGTLPLVPTKSKSCVTALLEIAAGKIDKDYKKYSK